MTAVEEPRTFARAGDPATSWMAAKSVEGITNVQAEVLFVLRRYGPLTQEQIVKQVKGFFGPKHSESGIRTRCKELVDKGLVVRTGERRKIESGRQADVFAAVLDG